MAEPQQEESIVPHKGTGGELAKPTEPQSVLARFGLGKEPSKAAPYLRVIFAGLKEAGSSQLEQIPIVGPLLMGAGAALLELSAEEDDAVFEQRITEILENGRRSGESLEVLTALSSAIYLQQGFLLDRLESQGIPAQREKLTSVALSTALAAYRGRVARDYQYADYRGIEGGTRAEHAASLPLDQVYVLPRLVSERSRIDSREREGQLLKSLLDNEDLAPGERAKLEEEFALLTGERWRALKKEEQGLPVGEALGSTRHAVVIGSPGVGKSALTRFLARTCALGKETVREKLGWDEELTPIVLPLAAYADARSRTSGLTLREHLDKWLKARGDEALQEAVSNELQAGRVLILFDGVDEIPDSRERVLIVKAVEQFLGDHAANRVFITSRPYGYVRLAGEIPHYQLPNFSPEQVKEFVGRWQRAFEQWRHPDAPDLTKADQQAKDMVEEIRRNPKVEDLASNPLMLMIFALIRHEQARLPEERVQLYNRAVNTLMDSWNRGRCLAGIDVGGAKLPLDRLVRVWGAVAEWTRRTKPTGVVYRAELKNKLIEILRNEELDEDDPEATAESYLNAAADRAGLLEERGRDVFAFWHPTFEEFLAAVELVTPSAYAVDNLMSLRDDPRWREVILLAISYLGIVQRDRDTATGLARAIWRDSPGPLEPLLHSYLRLAASCVSGGAGIKKSLIEDILVELGTVVKEYPYEAFVGAFYDLVDSVPLLRPSPPLIAMLVDLVGHQSWKVRFQVARLLGNVAIGNDFILGCLGRLLDDPSPSVRSAAAFVLMRAGDERPSVWATCSLVVYHVSGGFKREVKAWLISNRERVECSAIPWLKLPDADLQVRAATLLIMANIDLMSVERVLESMSDKEDADLFFGAFFALSEAGLAGGDPLRVMLKRGQQFLKWVYETMPERKASALSGVIGDPEDNENKELRVIIADKELPSRNLPLLLARGVGRDQLVSHLEKLVEGGDPYLVCRGNIGLLKIGARSDLDLVEKLARSIDPQPWSLLSSCQKLQSREPLFESEVLALRDFVRQRSADNLSEREVREAIFDWMWDLLDAQALTALQA